MADYAGMWWHERFERPAVKARLDRNRFLIALRKEIEAGRIHIVSFEIEGIRDPAKA